MGQKGTCTFVGKDLETLFYFLIQYNVYFYCMPMVYMSLLTCLGVTTKKRKLQIKAYKIMHSLPLNDSISPRNERNDQDPSSIQEQMQQEEDGTTNS